MIDKIVQAWKEVWAEQGYHIEPDEEDMVVLRKFAEKIKNLLEQAKQEVGEE